MFKQQQKGIDYPHFVSLAQLTAMFLNFSLLQRLDLSDPRGSDPRFVARLQAAYERLRASSGLQSRSAAAAESIFRKALEVDRGT